jgi:hypothetical protein
MYTKSLSSKIYSLAIMITALFLIFSCKGGNKSAEQDQLAADSLNKELLASDLKEVLYPLPRPFEITQMLTEIGAVYTPKNLNDAKKVKKDKCRSM